MSQQESLVCNYEEYTKTIDNLNFTIYAMIISIGLLVVCSITLAFLYLLEMKRNQNNEELEPINNEEVHLADTRYEYA